MSCVRVGPACYVVACMYYLFVKSKCDPLSDFDLHSSVDSDPRPHRSEAPATVTRGSVASDPRRIRKTETKPRGRAIAVRFRTTETISV